MHRLIANPTEIVEGAVGGFIKAHPRLVRPTPNPRVVAAAEAPIQGKVGIVTGGVTGLEPGFLGYVGTRMVDAVAVGEVFSSPTPDCFFDAFQEADGGAGVACLYSNNPQDNANVALASLLATGNGIEVVSVVARDDVCSAPPEAWLERRGGAGMVFMWKVAAALASLGADLDEVQTVAQRAIEHCRSVAVGLQVDGLTGVQGRTARSGGMMELGVGLHGEPGIGTRTLRPASGIAADMAAMVLENCPPFKRCNEVAVLLSGLGGTPQGEVYAIYDAIFDEIARHGHSVYRAYVGNYFASLDTVGATLSVMTLDEELKGLLDMDAECPALG